MVFCLHGKPQDQEVPKYTASSRARVSLGIAAARY